VPNTSPAAGDALPALEIVLEHARIYLGELDGPVRTPGTDAAAKSFGGALPEEGSGTLAAVHQLLERVPMRTSARPGRVSSTG
jgi:hypothetical protein